MKKVILFGIGNNGKKIIDAFKQYKANFQIAAIVDNYVNGMKYQEIPVVAPDEMLAYSYDEIWIPSVYYKEMRTQLTEELGISEAKIKYIEYPMPFIEDQIYKRYYAQINGSEKCISEELQNVIDYIAKNGVRMYCYPFFDEYMKKDIPVYYDKDNEMFYGVYSGHRMYLSKKFDTLEKARYYLRYAYMEQDRRSPHYYLEDGIDCKGKIIADIGAAEGIFALKLVDTAEYIYLFESDADWCEALLITFKEYAEKVTLIQGYVSDGEGDDDIVLDTFFHGKKIDLIKMDIEGAEKAALHGAEKLLDTSSPRLVICTYHNAGDNQEIRELLLKKGYRVENSHGYVVCQGEWELYNKQDVDFRRALLRAERKKENETGGMHT